MKEKLEEMFDDMSKFIISLVTVYFAVDRYPQQSAAVGRFVGHGIGMVPLTTWRLLNYNVVAWLMRPLLTFVLVVQTLLLVLGLAPIIALRYFDMTLGLGLPSLAVLGYLYWRRSRLTSVIPVTTLEDFELDDVDFAAKYGPDGRFSVFDLIVVPVLSLTMGALTIFIAVLTKHCYSTSAIIVWVTAFFGVLSVLFAFAQYKLVIGMAKTVVGGPLDWVERALGFLAKLVIHVPIPFITEANVGNLLPDSAVNKLKELITSFETAYHRALTPIQLMAAFAAVSVSLWLTSLVAFILTAYALVIQAQMNTGDDGLTKTAKANTIAATRLVSGSLLLAALIYRIVESFIFELHAVPEMMSAMAIAAAFFNWVASSFIVLIIALVAVMMAVKKLSAVKKAEDGWLNLSRIVAGILTGVALVLVAFIWSFWAGMRPTVAASYELRYEHTSDEALYCLNGQQDFDEIYTDHGPSCSRYRRHWQDTEWLSSSPVPVTYEEIACGNPAECTLRSMSEAWRGSSRVNAAPATAQQAVASSDATSNAVAAPIAMGVRSDKAATPVARPSNFSDLIAEASRQYGVDADLIRAVIRQESNFDPNVTGAAGEWGLMQLMPRTAAGVGLDRAHAYEPRANIMAGTRVLRSSLNACREDIHCTLSRYNGGPRGMHSWRAQRYAGRVMSRYNNYRAGQGLPQVYVAASLSSPRASREVANEPREVAMADLTVDASDCANFSNAARDVMRSIGRCR